MWLCGGRGAMRTPSPVVVVLQVARCKLRRCSGCGAVPGGALASLARYALCVPVVWPRPKQRAPASSSVG